MVDIRQPSPRPRAAEVLVVVLGASALAVGALATIQPLAAIAVVVGAAIVLVVAADIDALPVFLVFTMFVSSLSLGPGLAIGRVAGPMALAVLIYYVLERGTNELRPNALLSIVFLYGLWTLFSVYWATDEGLVYTAMFSYLIALAYMLTFAVIVRHVRQVLAVFATFAVGSFLFGVASFAAFYASSASERSAGLVGDPNFFAVYQVLALPPTLVLAARETRPGRRLAYLAIVGVIVLSVVSSLSRTGLVALTAIILATLVLPWRIFFARPGQKVTYFLMLVAASAIAVGAGSASFIQRAQSILDPGSAEGDRGAGRLDLWRAAVHGWKDHPWAGSGASNFQAHALDLLQTTPGVNTRASYVRAGREVHNAYLEELFGLGVIGLTLFALVLLVSAWYFIVAFRRARRAREPLLERLSLALLVSLVGFALSAIFLSNQLSRALWILVGLALALDVMTRRLRLPAAAGGASVLLQEPPYDLPVGESATEQQRRAAQQMEEVVAAERRLDRRRSSLAEREGEFEARVRDFEELEQSRAVIAQQIARGAASVAEGRRALAEEEEQSRERLTALQEQLDRAEERLKAIEQRSLELEQGSSELQQLSSEHERLAAELLKREQELEARAREIDAREAEGTTQLAGAEEALAAEQQTLEQERQALAEQRRGLEAEAALELEQRDAALQERIESAEVRLSEREHEVSGREAALDARRHELELLAAQAERPQPPPAAPPQPAPAPSVSTTADHGPALAPATWNLDVLEHLVVKHGAEFPDRSEEWAYYLVFLRDHAGLDRQLPESFEGLVLEVFGDVIEREREFQ